MSASNNNSGIHKGHASLQKFTMKLIKERHKEIKFLPRKIFLMEGKSLYWY